MQEGEQMGRSLIGKESGKGITQGITQRKDGIYQGRFVNRFGKEKLYGFDKRGLCKKIPQSR